MTQDDAEPRHDTRAASAILIGHGYKVSPATLTKFRCLGGGPDYEVWGRQPLYTTPNLLRWARSRSKPRPVHSYDERHSTDDAA
jgi:hypothetical protein